MKGLVAAVHVDFQIGLLSDPQIGQLSFLEIGVDPNFGERADRHQPLARLHVVPRIDVAPRDHAVDLGHDVAVPQVQFGLIEVALGLIALCLGQLDVGRFLDESGIDAVQISRSDRA